MRRVVWVLTSNGDVIYRFDPRSKAFGVLPMPRPQAFLRMLDVDPATGVLVTSYANIVDIVQGPRMALVIDPGDDAYPQRFTPGTAAARGRRLNRLYFLQTHATRVRSRWRRTWMHLDR